MEFIQEDDFFDVMERTIKPWIKEASEEGYLTSYDGLKLHYAVVKHPEETGRIQIFHGFCEFWPKYYEMAYYLYQQGYSVYFLEQRGHGYSGREVEQNDMVHVTDYDDYLKDQKQFHDEVVAKTEDGSKPRVILLAHSMGGLVGTRYLETYPDDFERAVLSSPLLRVNPGGVPEWSVSLIAFVSKVLHWDKKFSVGQHGYVDRDNFLTSSTRSRPRFDYVRNCRREDTHYQTAGADYSWSRASLRAVKEAQRDATKVKTPFILFQAGHDHLVKVEGQDAFYEKCKAYGTLVRFPDSRHEIFNSLIEDRTKYYEEVFKFLG